MQTGRHLVPLDGPALVLVAAPQDEGDVLVGGRDAGLAGLVREEAAELVRLELLGLVLVVLVEDAHDLRLVPHHLYVDAVEPGRTCGNLKILQNAPVF